MSGDAQSDVCWNGGTAGIAATPSGSVVFADHKYHKVYKKEVVGSKWGIVWVADVVSPFAMFVDSEGFIWISAESGDSITILSAQGRKVQEIKEEKLTLLTDWGSIMVHGGYLYITHAGGVGRFKLAHANV